MWSLGVSLLICRVTTNFPYLAIKAGRFTSHCGETGVWHAFFLFIYLTCNKDSCLKAAGSRFSRVSWLNLAAARHAGRSVSASSGKSLK